MVTLPSPMDRRCIYCLHEKAENAFNVEHVLPKAFGKFEHNVTLDCVWHELQPKARGQHLAFERHAPGFYEWFEAMRDVRNDFKSADARVGAEWHCPDPSGGDLLAPHHRELTERVIREAIDDDVSEAAEAPKALPAASR